MQLNNSCCSSSAGCGDCDGGINNNDSDNSTKYGNKTGVSQLME